MGATVSPFYTYINPLVGILLGWALLGESLTLLTVAGMGVTVAGVWLVNRGAS